jgi:hypothetical protein
MKDFWDTLELGLNGIFFGIKWDVSLGAKSRLHFRIHCDTNGCTDFTDFTDCYGFFLFFCLGFEHEFQKNP